MKETVSICIIKQTLSFYKKGQKKTIPKSMIFFCMIFLFLTFVEKLPQMAMQATFFELVYLHGILVHIHLA